MNSKSIDKNIYLVSFQVGTILRDMVTGVSRSVILIQLNSKTSINAFKTAKTYKKIY